MPDIELYAQRDPEYPGRLTIFCRHHATFDACRGGDALHRQVAVNPSKGKSVDTLRVKTHLGDLTGEYCRHYAC
jgi:hypothetical protein